jgi:CDP-diacylglycerol--serine O-phosphatidyltransferase
MINSQSTQPSKGSPIYLLPSLFTLAAMFCGFYAIIQSISGDFISCGIAIFMAMILDSLDGRVARLTHTSSPFGAELDSLSDMVNFGIAPAVIVFNWHLYHLGKLGWLFAFIYCACASLRLARFNTMLEVVSKNFFIGLPSPTAAAILVGYIYFCAKFNLTNNVTMIIGAVITLFAAFSMVSNVRFYSFKEIHFNHKAKFSVLLIFLIGLVVLIINPDIVIYCLFILYTLFSYLWYIFKVGKHKVDEPTDATISTE